MLEENIHGLIIRLFSGEANPNEKVQVRDWLNQSEENRKMYSDLQEIWLASESSDEYNTEQAISRFKENIKAKRTRFIRFSNLLKYAAVVILLISLSLIYNLVKQKGSSEDSYTTITCNLGDKSLVSLPDGSIVNLNSGSKLSFNNNFKNGYRQVFLEGEAYFSVKKNDKIPFIVNAAEIEVEVLGTEFNLKAYPEEKTISTTLVEGSVQLRSKYQKTVLEPSQKVVFDRNTKRMKLFHLKNVCAETEWKEGRLIFRNQSLEELELKLERWFDVDIEFADEEVKRMKFSGILERESILETLAYFNYSESVGYKIKDNEITFFLKK